MAREPLADFIEALMNKYQENTTFVNNPENIVIGESITGFAEMHDDKFPRIELLIDKLKYNGFIDQRQQDQSFRFSVGAHLRREQEETTREDMYTAIRWGRELIRDLFLLHEDRSTGNPPCEGFIQIEGYPEIDYEYELIPKISSVLLVGAAEITLLDTFTNN